MEPVNILEIDEVALDQNLSKITKDIACREELRRWYEENHAAAREFWLPVNRVNGTTAAD